MGDAGPPTPPPGLDALHPEFDTTDSQHPPLREVKVLVTGFGVGLPIFSSSLRPCLWPVSEQS